MTTSPAFSIGVLARRTACSVPTIRYYEAIGLLQPGARTEAGRRVYDESAVRRLGFIRRCRDFGFAIEQVRELVGLMDEPDRPCIEVREVAAGHLAHLRGKLAELQALERAMTAFVSSCDGACAGGAALDCNILEDLAAPAGEARLLQSPSCCAAG